MFTPLLIALLLAPVQAPAPPKVEEVVSAPVAKAEEMTARVGQLKRVRSTDVKARWELKAGTVGAEIITDGQGGCAFTAEEPGIYTLVCYTTGPCTWVVITVEGKTPKPDVKPDPNVPPQPKPVAPVVAAIKEAFKSDGGATVQNQADAAALAGFWEAGVEHCDNKKVLTAGKLLDQIREQAGKALPPTRLPATRKAIGEATLKLFGSQDAELTDQSRAAAKEMFALFAKNLEELSK
jgi:hypothetical protein